MLEAVDSPVAFHEIEVADLLVQSHSSVGAESHSHSLDRVGCRNADFVVSHHCTVGRGCNEGCCHCCHSRQKGVFDRSGRPAVAGSGAEEVVVVSLHALEVGTQRARRGLTKLRPFE